MSLKVKDVAEMFNVSETTVRRWISDGKIPTFRLNHLPQDYFFSISEMENWLMSHKLAKNQSSQRESKTQGVKNYSLYRAIHKGDILHDIKGRTKEEIIRNTIKAIGDKLPIDAEMVTELLLQREQLAPTALNNGVGVPHMRDILLDAHHDRVIIVFPQEPLSDYGALDHKPVHTLFFLFACEDKRHLHLLAKIAQLSSQNDSLQFFQNKPPKEEVLSYVKQWELSLF